MMCRPLDCGAGRSVEVEVGSVMVAVCFWLGWASGYEEI